MILLFPIGIIILFFILYLNFKQRKFIYLMCPFVCFLLLIIFLIGYINNNSMNIIIQKEQEREQIISIYQTALESHDKHIRTSALSRISVWNYEVEDYKKRSKNILIKCFYPEKIAKNLEYINI